MIVVVQVQVSEDLFQEVPDRMDFTGGDHEVVGFLVLQHQPHRLDVISGKPPVSFRVEVSQQKLFLQAEFDPGRSACDFSCHEMFATTWRFVVEQDPVDGKQPVGLAIVERLPVGEDLGTRVGATGSKPGRLVLRCTGGLAEHLARGGLVETGLVPADLLILSHCFEDPECTQAGDIAGVDRQVERYPNVALGREIVDFVGFDFRQQRTELRTIGQVAVVQLGPWITELAASVGDQPVDVVVTFEQEFGEVRPILSGESGDQGNTFHGDSCSVGETFPSMIGVGWERQATPGCRSPGRVDVGSAASLSPVVKPVDPTMKQSAQRFRIALFVAWLVGLLIVVPVEWSRASAVDGLADWLATFNVDSTAYLLLLLVLPLLALRRDPLLAGRRRSPGAVRRWLAGEAGNAAGAAWFAAFLVGGVSLCASAWVASRPVGDRTGPSFGQLPSALHDENSYLFQSRTFLSGHSSFPSHTEMPRLFDQVHVLNEGRFASRYFPGVGLWMAPFVALGHPAWGHWLAGVMTAMCIFGAGRELSGNAVGLLAGLLTAVSPGMALFSNLLLSHHPTLAGLSVFVFLYLRMLRTSCPGCGIGAGAGLMLAMLCRPLTAAAIGAPFGCHLIWWWWQERGTASNAARLRLLLLVGAPVLVGLLGVFFYNQALTGSGWRTPYQVYTDIYTPRHVYGFDNVVRGDAWIDRMDVARRERVLENYDRWAENLDAGLAWRNVRLRLVHTGQWTLGIIPLVSAAVILLIGGVPDGCRRWWLVVGGIVVLHLAHVPYWYDGIMHWHYVFESGPLWCLVFAGVTIVLMRCFREWNRPGLSIAWWGMIVFAVSVSYGALDPLWLSSRIDQAVGEAGFARNKFHAFQQTVRSHTGDDRALVLVAADPADRHIDYVVNSPSLQETVLFGRYEAAVKRANSDGRSVSELLRAGFPGRRLFLFDARSGKMKALPE